jgi:hypothetical protein
VSVGGEQRESADQQVEWTGRSRRRGKGPDGVRDLDDDAPRFEAACDCRRAPGDQVGLACEVEVERLEPSRGPSQQRRSVAAAQGEGDVATQEVDPGALEPVERSGLGCGRQLER